MYDCTYEPMYVCNPYKCIRMNVYVRVYVCVCIYMHACSKVSLSVSLRSDMCI